jgi:uroporphyrinogen-III synthase
LPAGAELKEYDAISIRLLPVSWGAEDQALCIFTSRNAVRACFQKGTRPSKRLSCVCVGRGTAALLRHYGQRVLQMADGAEVLFELITQKYSDQSFIYFCGNRRLDILPNRMREAGIPIEERIVYETELNVLPVECAPDAVLFFSPSGVESYTTTENLEHRVAICIGPTTAAAAEKYTEQIIIAEKPSVEAVLQAASTFISNAYET